jgi:hypothetical protein
MQQTIGVICLFHPTPHTPTPVHLVDTQNQSTSQLSHSFSPGLSLVLALSLYTLSHSSKRRRKGRRRGGDWRPPAAAHHHEDHLGAAVHKRWVLEEGGALSSSPFGARRRRKQEEEEELELPRSY